MKGIVKTTLAGLLLAASGSWAGAQDFPTKPITLVAPYPPGAVTDLVARVLQPKLSELLGQPVVVENKPGAGGNSGSAAVAKSAPDGHTLLVTVNPPINTNQFLFKDFPFDPEALTGVTLIGETYMTLSTKSTSPFNTVADIIAAAKERPGEITYGSAGVGSGHHVAGELLNKLAGIQLNHIPYQGGAPAVQDAAAGQIDLTFGTVPAVRQFVDRGDMKIIALAEKNRWKGLPDVPTIAETVPGVETATWIGLLAPTGTPQPVIDKLYNAAKTALEDPAAQKQLIAAGLEPVISTPAEFNDRIAAEREFWSEAIKTTGIPVQ